ncbi:MAG: DUF1800 domain-containing protein [Bacteroidetes bacterium]|nr:DUF1800 domain-containing protein [Bacteroidota bacterium]
MVPKSILHLFSRAGFGMPLTGLHQNRSLNQSYEWLWQDAVDFTPLQVIGKDEKYTTPDFMNPKVGEVLSRQQLIKDLNFAWLNRMVSGKAVLREKMTLFWANHFACRSGNPLFAQQLNNIIRKHALGNFKTLLLEVSKSPAMLQFLNNQQNRKAHPNENFAREVMELFTLGHGNYTEKDVTEAARAFTGWTFNREGMFEFRERIHDDSTKEFLGKSGTFTGDDIIEILLKQKQTALFITGKFWKAFVSEKLDANRINLLAEKFYQSGFEIEVLLREVFLSEWFYSTTYYGALIKSPIELMVPLIRDFKVEFANPNVAIGFQKLLGQVLFNPPNVAGWPGGRNWIDSSSLSFRMRMGRILLNDEIPDQLPKQEGDNNNAFDVQLIRPKQKNEANLMHCITHFKEVKDDQLFDALAQWMMAVPVSPALRSLFRPVSSINDRSVYIKEVLMYLTTLPEYQVG